MSAWTDRGFPHNLRFANPRDVYNTLAAAAEERARVFNGYTLSDFDRLGSLSNTGRTALEAYVRYAAGNYVQGVAPANEANWPTWTAAALEQQYGIPAAPQRLEHKLDVRWAIRMYKLLNCCTTLQFGTDYDHSALYAASNSSPPKPTMAAALNDAIPREGITSADYPEINGAVTEIVKVDEYGIVGFNIYCYRRQWLSWGPGAVRSNPFGYFPADLAAEATLYLYVSDRYRVSGLGTRTLDYFNSGSYGFTRESWNQWGTRPVSEGQVGEFDQLYPEYTLPPVEPTLGTRFFTGFNVRQRTLLVNCAVEGGFAYYDPPEIWIDL